MTSWGHLPAVSAIFLAGLYGLGVLLNAARLHGAHISVRDTLPLIPLQDHLTTALATLFSSTLVFAWVVVGFAASLIGYAWFKASEAAFERATASIAVIRADADRLHAEIETEGDASLQDIATVEKEIEELANASMDDDEAHQRLVQYRARVQALKERSAEFRARSNAALAGINEKADRVEAMRPRVDRIFLTTPERGKVVMRAAAVGTVLLAIPAPPITAVGSLALALLSWFWIPLMSLAPLICVALWVAITAGPFLVGAYVDPVPLPAATVHTTKGIVRGGLVTQNGDRVVLAQSRGATKTIPDSEVQAILVSKATRKRPKSLFNRVFD